MQKKKSSTDMSFKLRGVHVRGFKLVKEYVKCTAQNPKELSLVVKFAMSCTHKSNLVAVRNVLPF